MAENKEELQGTFINKGAVNDSFTELDSMIAETLQETKAKEPAGAAPKKEEIPFKATPFIKEKPPEVKVPEALKAPLTIKTVPLQQEQPAKEAKKDEPQDQYAGTFKTFNAGDIVPGTVAKIDQAGILVDIQYKSDGFVRAEELDGRELKVGDKVDVFIESLSNKDGNVELSLKQAKAELKWKVLFDSFNFKTAVEAKVTSAVGGGLVVDCGGVRGFVPASQVAKKGEASFAEFVGRTIPVKVLEIDRRRGKVILSHKLGNYEQQKKDKDQAFDQIEVGSVLKGRVSNIKNFGAFVNIDGIEGLVHKNDISWKRVADPSAVLKTGQEVEVFVLGVDKINKKLSLGLKQLQPDPWVSAAEKYRAGQTVPVKVLRFAKFGAFVEIEEGVEGLIHISELSQKPVQNMEEAVKIGEVVNAKILRIVPEEQKIGLSIKAVAAEEEKKEFAQARAAQQPPKITIGDTVGSQIKDMLNGNNPDELPPSA